MGTFVAVDLGAQSGRVAVGRLDGDRLSVTEVHRFANVPARIRDILTWDVRRLYDEVLAGLRAAAGTEPRVDSIGVDSWAVDFGLIDRSGRLVQSPVHYRDGRRARAMSDVLERIPGRELYERTGIQLLPINTIFELAAMAAEHDPALEAAETLLLIPDLMQYWLCGARQSELTNATTTQCFDPRSGRWATDLLERLGVPTRLLPEVGAPGSHLGRVSGSVAAETGLSDVEVVAVASHDTASAVAAIPFDHPDAAFVSAGTWSLVGVEVREPVITDAAFEANLTNEGGVDGTFRLLRNVTGLWLLHECRRAWALEGHEYTFDALTALAERASPLRSLIDPNDPVFTDPGDMPARIRAWCRAAGQPEPLDHGDVVRCVLESLALAHARSVELVGAVAGTSPGAIHVVGGGARNQLLCRSTADASGLTVHAGPAEATLAGNLLVQAIAHGELASVADARAVVARSFPSTTYEPQVTAEWQEARERFRELGTAPLEAKA